MLLRGFSEDSDQTSRMPIFAGCTCHIVGFVMVRLICMLKY